MKGPLLAVLAAGSCAAACAAGPALSIGIHVHEGREVGAAAEAGFAQIRLWDSFTRWADLQPEPGRIRLAALEARVTQAERLGLRVILTLGSTPQWASMRPMEPCAYGHGCAAPPLSLEHWRNYVRTVAAAFAGRIECYETWNEVSFPSDPDLVRLGAQGDPRFFSGTPAQLAALQQVAFEEIRKADPAACVLSPSFHSSGNWNLKLDRFLASGGKSHFDKLSWHFYFGDLPEDTRRVMGEVRAVLARHGLADVEIWNTEVGIPFALKRAGRSATEFREFVHAMTLRTYLVNFDAGVKRVYWYAWDNSEFGLSRERSGTGTVAMEATRAAIDLLRGARSVHCPGANVVDVWHCAVRYRDGSVREIAWSTVGRDRPTPEVVLSRPARRWGAEAAPAPAGRPLALGAVPWVSDAIRRDP